MATSTTTISSTATTNLSTPDGSYIYSVVRASSSALAAIASDDSLRIFDPRRLSVHSTILNTHNLGVTSLTTVSEYVLATAGRDGLVKIWDTRLSENEPTVVLSNTGSTHPILSLAINPDTGIVAVGTERPENTHAGGDVLLWDVRTPKTPKVRYTESHNDDVTELRFHPRIPHLLLSGSTDALVNVYDLRTPPAPADSGTTDDEEALVQVLNHGSSIHHAGFVEASPTKAPEIWAMSHDEQLGVYGFYENPPVEGEYRDVPSKIFGDVRTTLGCEYVVDVLRREYGALVAAGSYEKSNLKLVPLTREGDNVEDWELGAQRNMSYEFIGVHSGEIVRSLLVDEATGAVYTAGEDGRIMVWRPDGWTPQVQSPREKKDKKRRFKPY
ncbi:WD domain protein [Geopyxis carbonaria]|nr:WD domain protein [Geopyxis carbonaria]